MSPELIAIITAAAIIGFLWNLHRDVADLRAEIGGVRAELGTVRWVVGIQSAITVATFAIVAAKLL